MVHLVYELVLRVLTSVLELLDNSHYPTELPKSGDKVGKGKVGGEIEKSFPYLALIILCLIACEEINRRP